MGRIRGESQLKAEMTLQEVADEVERLGYGKITRMGVYAVCQRFIRKVQEKIEEEYPEPRRSTRDEHADDERA